MKSVSSATVKVTPMEITKITKTNRNLTTSNLKRNAESNTNAKLEDLHIATLY